MKTVITPKVIKRLPVRNKATTIGKQADPFYKGIPDINERHACYLKSICYQYNQQNTVTGLQVYSF